MHLRESGKRVLNQEPLVGLDTDWIRIGLIWYYSPLLRMKVPIVTNQPHAFIESGLKIIGV
jgi:hypothetical protein